MGVQPNANALTASTTLAGALAGRITEPVAAGGTIMAATEGQVTVHDDGSSSYSIPLWTPQGVAGLSPELSIEYSSSLGRGFFGPRVTLGGISKITRCPPTIAQDAHEGTIDFSGDTFCLDGHRLIRTSGTPGATGEFRTERNPFSKIVVTAAGAQGPLGFQVWQPSGRIASYGMSATTRVHGVPYAFPSGTATAVTYAWYLDKVADRYNNAITISYANGSTSEALNPSELIPNTIQYGQRSVTFQYFSASTSPSQTQWINGLGIVFGALPKEIYMSGPGASGTQILKSYRFTYTAPTTSGVTLLTSLVECDATGVDARCKRPTGLTWEAGSLQYSKTDFGISDAAQVLQSDLGDDSAVLRRIIPVDLNSDGMDDIVYRTHVGSTTNCIGWAARLAQRDTSNGPTGVVFGSPISLPLGGDPDPSCIGGGTPRPYPGDLIFADLNSDGFPDLISPMGQRSNGITSLSGYHALFNSASATAAFGAPVAFEDQTLVNVADAAITLGGLSRNLLPAVFRPLRTGDGGLWAATVSPSGAAPLSVANNPFPDGSHAVNTSLIDIDGDGQVEVLRDSAPTGLVNATSSTMNGVLPGFPAVNPGATPSAVRWFLDLNGDGRSDVAWVTAAAPTQVHTLINTGRSFKAGVNLIMPAGFQIGQSWTKNADDGVRIVDFNGDGRQDLILVDKGVVNSVATRNTAAVLLSDGNGGFTPLATTIPIGDFSDGTYNMVSPDHGYRTTVSLDANGDGLPDLLQLEAGHLVLYTRQGATPDVVTQIVEGTGRTMSIAYSSFADANVYTPDRTICSTNRSSLRCATRGLVAKSLSVQGGDISNSDLFTYTAGVSDVKGRGFLGFKQRDVFSAIDSRHTALQYEPISSMQLSSTSYTYPIAFEPTFIQKDASDQDSSENFHFETITASYEAVANSDGTWSWLSITVDDRVSACQMSALQAASTVVHDVAAPAGRTDRQATKAPEKFGTPPPAKVPGASGPKPKIASRPAATVTKGAISALLSTASLLGAPSCNVGTLSRAKDIYTYDTYGNSTSHERFNYDNSNNGGAWIQHDIESRTFDPANTTLWLTGLLRQDAIKSIVVNRDAQGVTRTISFTPDPATGDLSSMTVEPSGDSTLKITRTVFRDPSGRLQSVTDSDGGSSRTTTFQYQDADGAYVSSVIDPLNHPTRIWRHPGWGMVVEVDDVNNLPAAWSYDTFGRRTSATATSGRSIAWTYLDSQVPGDGGIDMTVIPERAASRSISVHLDPFNHETKWVAPIDSTHAVQTVRLYDAFGRVKHEEASSINGANTTTLNFHDLFYDDLDRLRSDCHLVSNGPLKCRSTEYDWGQVNTFDEAGRWSQKNYDPMGRIANEVTTDSSGEWSYANFSYLEFGLLAREDVDDGHGTNTTFGYDTLGRKNLIQQSDVGARTITRNAFGDITGTAKLKNDGTVAEQITYVPDALGRVTSASASGLSRSFYWDRAADGSIPPYAIGKLIDANDGTSNVSVHFTYGSQGLPLSKSWQVPGPSGGTETYVLGLAYDSQGKVSTINYPAIPGETQPLSVQYAYDQYSGAVATLTDLSSPGTPVWAVTARNEWGSATGEALTYQGHTLTSAQSRYLPDNRPHVASLTGANGAVSLEYTYEADNLVSSLKTTTPTTNWTETFQYDDLGQMTGWKPDVNAPSVSYGYDQSGRMLYRLTANQSVGYNAFAMVGSARALTTRVNTNTPENYMLDLWGRVTDTPAATIGYNAADEMVSVVEKPSNQVDSIVRDALGRRVLTRYGNGGALGSLLSLDELFEVKRTSGVTEGRCRLKVGSQVVADLVRANGAARTATFYLSNSVGSVVAEGTSATGNVAARSRRDPFGNLLDNPLTPLLPADPLGTNPDGSSRLGFGTHERDAAWGLVDMLARQYSPRLGRFVSPDSVIWNPGDRRDYNPYTYVHNNPSGRADLDGHGFADVGGDGSGQDPSGGADSGSYTYSYVDADGTYHIVGVLGAPPPSPGHASPGPISGGAGSGTSGGGGGGGGAGKGSSSSSSGKASTSGSGGGGSSSVVSRPSSPAPLVDPVTPQVPASMGVAESSSTSRSVSSVAADIGKGLLNALPGAHFAAQAGEAWNEGRYGRSAALWVAAFADAALAFATLGESSVEETVVRDAADEAAQVGERAAQAGESAEAEAVAANVNKAVNSNLPHAIERGVERGIFASPDEAGTALRELTEQITKTGTFPAGTLADTANAGRFLVPVGNNGLAVYQLAANGTAKLKTVLVAR